MQFHSQNLHRKLYLQIHVSKITVNQTLKNIKKNSSEIDKWRDQSN